MGIQPQCRHVQIADVLRIGDVALPVACGTACDVCTGMLPAPRRVAVKIKADDCLTSWSFRDVDGAINCSLKCVAAARTIVLEQMNGRGAVIKARGC